jgi:hypothetical protein
LNDRFRAGLWSAKKGSKENEGPGIGEEDLREVQGDYSPGRGTRDLRESQAQAAPGISKTWQERGLPRQVSGVRFQGSVKDDGSSKIELTPGP